MNMSLMTDTGRSDGLKPRTSLVSPVPRVLTSPGGEAGVEEGKQHGSGRTNSMPSFPEYVSKFRNKMVEIRTSFRATARMGLYHQYWIPPYIQTSSSSTPTVPLSQRVYSSGDGAGSSPHPGSSQEAAVGAEVGGWDCRSSDLQKLKELDLHGNSARPLSRSGANNRKEKVSVSYDHIQEELRPLGCGGAGGSSKQSLTLPPNGLRNHVLRTEHFLPQRSPHGPPSGQEEDPIAMGSLWSPNHQQLHTRGSSTVTTTTTTTAINSTASKTLPASVGNGNGSSVGSFISIAGSLPTRRPAPSAASTSLTLHHSSSAPAPTMGNIVKSKDKEVEPKYSDPVPGAPASFQQRLMELAALEAETVRWERSKKVKKKPLKQDKES